MSDMYPEDGLDGLDGFDLEQEVAPAFPEAQPTLDDMRVDYAAGLTGEQAAAAAGALVNTPQAQQFLVEYQAAEEAAMRDAAAPAIHSFLDAYEGKLGVTVNRHAVIDDANGIVEDLVRSEGTVETDERKMEIAEQALAIAARRDAGRETYDDVIARHVAKVRR